MKLACVIALCVFACAPLSARQRSSEAYTIQLPPSPDFKRLDWMVGTWSGKTVGAKPSGTVTLSISYGLDKRFMLFRESISLPGTKVAPAIKENLLGVLSAGPAGGEFAMDLYSSSGFVTHYQAMVKSAEIDFNPAGGRMAPEGWLFRRAVKRTDTGQCRETVSVAPPGQAFFDYYTADLHRTSPIAEPQSPSAPSEGADSEKQPAQQ